MNFHLSDYQEQNMKANTPPMSPDPAGSNEDDEEFDIGDIEEVSQSLT